MGETNTCVVLLVGIPAAGKTTFCRNHLKLGDNIKLKLIHYDDLVEDFTSLSRKLIFQHVDYLIQDCLLGNCKYLIVIDDNMYYKSMRKQYINLCKRYNLGFYQIYFQVDLQTALIRNVNRSNNVPSDIIVDMYKKLEVPADDVFVINSNFKFENIDELNLCLSSVFQNPLKQSVNKEPILTNISRIHHVDLILRKIIGEYAKIDNKKDIKLYNVTKKVLLRNIKNGNVDVDHICDDGDLWKVLQSYFLFFCLVQCKLN